MSDEHTPNAADYTDHSTDTPSQKLRRVPDPHTPEETPLFGDKRAALDTLGGIKPQSASSKIEEWITEWEEEKPEPEVEVEAEKPEPEGEAEAKSEPEPVPAPTPEEEAKSTEKVEPEPKQEVEPEVKAEEQSASEGKAEAKSDPEPEPSAEAKEAAEPEAEPEPAPEPKVKIPGVYEKYEPVPAPKHEVSDVALIFEGGGMRAAYTSAAVVTLIENGIHFNDVYGVSAGASNTANYVSWDPWRAHESFTEFSLDPKFGSTGTLLMHQGLFNADYIYRQVSRPGGPLPFDFDAFMENPSRATFVSFRRDTGETVYFTKNDMHSVDDLMLRVRASSTLPFFMPPVKVDGYVCYDGGLGEGGGIALPKAEADGFEKFFVVRSRPRGYRKPIDEGANLGKTFFWHRPHAREALLLRPTRYNATVKRLEDLEAEGRAYVVYADDIDVSSSERDIEKLRDNYAKGYAQMQRELEAWAAFLGI